MGFPRQEYCSGLPCPPQGDLPDPEVKPASPALQADSLPEKPDPKGSFVVALLRTSLQGILG